METTFDLRRGKRNKIDFLHWPEIQISWYENQNQRLLTF